MAVPHSGYIFGYICVLLTLLPVIRSNGTQDICNRDPPGTTAARTPGDNGFRIKIVGRPQPERYTPGQVYTVVINGTYPNQRMLGFMLVAVPLNAKDESTDMGSFQHLHNGATKYAEDCPYVITHSYNHPKAGIEVLWTAPPAGTGCIEFRATVIEYNDIWYKDDGALTSVFCEETGTTESHQSPEMIPECCACGSAKYQMTFHGTWSHRTHPKDFPDRKQLLHWSNIVGASHSKHYMIWQYGGYSSQGIRQVCEFGSTRKLETEMRQHSRDVRTVVKTPGIWWSEPHGLEQTRWARFSVDKNNHLVSMLSMIGPSPDWCVGISAVNLCLPNCTWTRDYEIDLYPWDAGTDDGVTYMSSNKVSEPQQKIHRITNTFPNNDKSPFFGRDPVPPLATLKIRRIHPKDGERLVCTGNDEFDDINDDIEESDDLAPDDMEKMKIKLMNDGKCAMIDWTDWSECSVTCGVGQRFRKRSYIDPEMNENMCGHAIMESENCIGFENECEKPDEECAVARWSDWSPCSVSCGKGTRSRLRFYYNPENIHSCSRQLEETEICMANILDCSKAKAQLNYTAICSEPKAIGRGCRGDFTRFYYDTAMGKCLPFSYTGCRGNNNNFLTEEECHDTCSSVMEAALSETANENTPDHNQNPMDESKEVQPDDNIDNDAAVTICSLPSEVGPCRARLTRYYFDTSLLICVPFQYGGCKGNENNFITEDACMDKCFMVMKQEMMNRKLQQDKQLTEDIQGQLDKQKTKDKKKDEKDDTKNNENEGKVDEKQTKPKTHKSKKQQKNRGKCKVGPWSDWSECSVSCGKGLKYKYREIVKDAPEGKKCTKTLKKEESCKAVKCLEERCKMSEWREWTPCPKTCGSGNIQERTRQVTSAPNDDHSVCGATLERRYCTVAPCPDQAESIYGKYRSP